MVVLLEIEMTKIQWWVTLNCSAKLQAAYSAVFLDCDYCLNRVCGWKSYLCSS